MQAKKPQVYASIVTKNFSRGTVAKHPNSCCLNTSCGLVGNQDTALLKGAGIDTVRPLPIITRQAPCSESFARLVTHVVCMIVM
ncbi:hypothetical protein Hanom_Chr14g01311311 [Helianthus anomalus]